ncbi:unnamed protein product [Meganyctiphanes norvegica]|uniref:LanC-like protein 2 n=1 Tax=Meganyctiphanes norvegica TaxID=48144 RepID=A0AAV2QHZ7_MEGNR
MCADRHFPNPYPSYDADLESGSLLDVANKKLSENFISSIESSVEKQLNALEEALKNNLDWNDISVYTGASGYIALYLNLAKHLKQDVYIQKALPIVQKALSHLKGRRFSFVCGDAGPLTLAAIIFNKLGRQEEADKCIRDVVQLKEMALSHGVDNEILYGRAGYLYALCLLNQEIGPNTVDFGLIRQVIDRILKSGKRKAFKNCPLMYEWHEKKYLGAAHGMCGILFMLLQVKEHLNEEELKNLVRPSVDYICSITFPSGNLPSSIGSSSGDKLIHWCHGAPGAIFLFTLAYKVFHDEKYLKFAQQSADVIWQRGLLKKGYGLCHGSSGNGYSLLYFFQTTGKVEDLYRTAQFASWCQDYGNHGCLTPDRPYSLFEGMAGCIHFLSSLKDIKEAKYPAFVL